MGEKVELFRYNEKTGVWKTVRLEKTEGGVFFSAEEGKKEAGAEKSKDVKRVTIKLTEQEIAYLAMKLMKMI